MGAMTMVLAGFTVGITADRRWEDQADLLARRGASVLHGASLRTHALDSDAALRAVTEEIVQRPPAFLIANTGVGIRAWLTSATSWGLREDLDAALRQAETYARGPKVAAVIRSAGLEVAWRAPKERLAEIVTKLCDFPLEGTRIAYQCHGEDVPQALEPLRAAGAEILEIPVYRWQFPQDITPALKLAESVTFGVIDAVTFTSAPAVHNFFAIAEEHDLGEVLRAAFNDAVLAACVGPVCAAALVQEGVLEPLVPERSRLVLMIRALTDRLVATGGVQL